MLDVPAKDSAPQTGEPDGEVTVELYRGMLPYEMQRAIFRTMGDVGTLAKEAYNDYAGYPYASVDQFYLRIVPVALRHGLRWDLTTSGLPRREGNIEWWTYSVTLHYLHEPDDRNVGWTRIVTDYARVVVKHPLRGPQDTGTTLSYADKSFMRMFLKIPTKEGDGDQHDNRHDLPLNSKPMEDLPEGDSRQDRRRQRRNDGWSEAISATANPEELDRLLDRGRSDLEELERQDLAAYRNVMKAVEERRRFFVIKLQSRATGQGAPSDPAPKGTKPTEETIIKEVAGCKDVPALEQLWRVRSPFIHTMPKDVGERLLARFSERKRAVQPPAEQPPPAPVSRGEGGRRVLRPPS